MQHYNHHTANPVSILAVAMVYELYSIHNVQKLHRRAIRQLNLFHSASKQQVNCLEHGESVAAAEPSKSVSMKNENDGRRLTLMKPDSGQEVRF